MTVHELKILPRWFEDVALYKKNFEIRRNDRDFKVGDWLLLREYERGHYTGREVQRKIQYIYYGDGTYGISEDFCVLGLEGMQINMVQNGNHNYQINNVGTLKL